MLDLYRYAAVLPRWPASIYDADTLRLDVDLGFRFWMRDAKFRLADIQAPEIKGAERERGLLARDFARDQLRDAEIRITPRAPDPVKFGRYLADVWYRSPAAGDQLPGDWLNLGAVLLDAGHATPYAVAVE